MPRSSSGPQTASASSRRQPPAKTASRANSRLDGSRRRSWLQAIVACRVRCRSGSRAAPVPAGRDWRPSRSAIAPAPEPDSRGGQLDPERQAVQAGTDLRSPPRHSSAVRRNPGWTRRARSMKRRTRSRIPPRARRSSALGDGAAADRILLLAADTSGTRLVATIWTPRGSSTPRGTRPRHGPARSCRGPAGAD